MSSLAVDEWHEKLALVARDMAYHPEARQTTNVQADRERRRGKNTGRCGQTL